MVTSAPHGRLGEDMVAGRSVGPRGSRLLDRIVDATTRLRPAPSPAPGAPGNAQLVHRTHLIGANIAVRIGVDSIDVTYPNGYNLNVCSSSDGGVCTLARRPR